MNSPSVLACRYVNDLPVSETRSRAMTPVPWTRAPGTYSNTFTYRISQPAPAGTTLVGDSCTSR
ncbi:MAG: hypothetical protein A4E39_01679 [Methanoregulaceae archaeon PtaB.Bin152]|nr:MAG: hypothetical protein A4E39_01679 [Methanoregulaceae archaeon PtaB.Bin152]